jgi:predicted permease
MNRLPRLVAVLVRLVAPARARDELIADLAEDYARVRGDSPPRRARWWLTRETISLVLAYGAAGFRGMRDGGPVWARDLRLVARGLRRGVLPATGAAAMLSTGLLALLLTVGLSDTLLFRQVSATHGDAFRRLGAVDRQGRQSLRLSFPEIELIREHLDGITEVTTVNMQPAIVRVAGADAQTLAEAVDGRYFSLTGITTIMGRGLLTTDDRPDAPPVAVVAEPFWRNHFGGSASALGQTIRLNGAPFTLVGVAHALGSSSFLGASVDAWVPLAHADALLNRGWRTDVNQRWFTSFVLPRTTAAEVEARLAAASGDLARRHPEPWRERRLQTGPATLLTGNQRSSVIMLAVILAGLAVLILATAASNVGGVMLARAVATRRHVAIHLSMGSGRLAIVRRQLIEGALLGIAGAVLALAVYVWARMQLAEIALLPTLSLRLDLPLDITLIAVVGIVGLGAGVVLALGPALWATRVDLVDAMRDADRGTSNTRGLALMRRVLVATQVCLSLALIVGAALFSRSLAALTTSDLGFARERLVAMDFDLEPAVPSMTELPALAQEALARAESTPGVLAAAMSNRAPIDQSTPATEVGAAQDGSRIADVTFYQATAGYFDTVGIPIVTGRAFTATESAEASPVTIVNETLAARLWPDGDVLDRPLYVGGEAQPVRVVGVARNSRYRSLSEPPRPHLYRPSPPKLGMTLLARASGDPRETLRALQRTLDGVGPGVVGFFPRTLDDHLAIDLLPTRAAAAAATLLGTLALALSGVGLYGLVSWLVELRRREIGVRMALGARARDVRALVVRQALATAMPGIIGGLVVSTGLATLARGALFNVGPLDPVALVVGVGSLGAIVMLAAYVPSRRATRIDPVRAMRDM